MRGKLRDKRADVRGDRFKRDVIERRKPARRDNRAVALLHRQLEDETLPVEEEALDKVTAAQKK